MSDSNSAGRLRNARKASPVARLKALREAADAGAAAIERGDCSEFSRMDDLVAHLDKAAGKRSAPRGTDGAVDPFALTITRTRSGS